MVDRTDPYPYLASGRSGRPKYGDIVRMQQEDGLLAARPFTTTTSRQFIVASSRSWTARSCLCWTALTGLEAGALSRSTTTSILRVDMAPDTHGAVSRNSDVNVAIYTTSNLRGEILDGRVSDFLDQARPSRRLCLEDTSESGNESRAYATVIVPRPIGRPIPVARRLDASIAATRELPFRPTPAGVCVPLGRRRPAAHADANPGSRGSKGYDAILVIRRKEDDFVASPTHNHVEVVEHIAPQHTLYQ